jgi:hypothetical protein
MNARLPRNSSWIAASWFSPSVCWRRMIRSALLNACSGMPSAAILFEPNRFRVQEYTM